MLRSSLIALILLASLFLPQVGFAERNSGSSGTEATKVLPNIVLILMDNFGYGELGVYGGGIIRGAETPRIDGLAAEGLRLTNFNVETQCTPTRAALMTGRYAIRSGNPTVPRHTPVYGLVDWEVTMPEFLSEVGYTNGIFGKWHLGQTEGRYPTDHGFDYWFGIAGSANSSYWTDHDGYDPESHPRAAMPHIVTSYKNQLPTRVAPFDEAARSTIERAITEQAISFIEQQSGQDEPFFAYIPYTNVHWPVKPHADFVGRTGNGTWADALSEIDYNVGQILDSIDRAGIANDTIVIFTSDGGPDAIYPMVGDSGPWRGTYVTNLEGGVRVPFIMRWPERVQAGRVSNELVHVTDLFTSIARLTDSDIPNDRIVDGIDQTDFFFGANERSNRDHVIIYVGKNLSAVKWRHWKMHYEHFASGDMFGAVERLAIPRLYDLFKDPKELNNVMLDNTWIRWPINALIVEHRNSFDAHPAIPQGAPDDFIPGASSE